MGIVIAVSGLLVVFVAERATAYVRKARIDKRRSQADYPVTDYNDPIGNNIA